MAYQSFELFHAQPTKHPNPQQNDTVFDIRNSSSQPPMYHKLFSENSVVSDPTIKLKSTVPLGPFTGYAAILKRSSFLVPAQQLLDELFGSGNRVTNHRFLIGEGLTLTECTDRIGYSKNTRLVFMLQEVYKRCKICCQQIQSVVTSFETVAGLANAAPFISYAIRAISDHFGSLKNVILTQLRVGSNFLEDHEISKKGIVDQIPFRNLSNNSIWRSHRGLPQHAVAVLKKWLFEHFLHPYPTDSEKQMLAQQTGLSRTQVSNWFINSRVRLWKPMVEEINDLHKQKSPETTSTNKRLRNDNYHNNNNNNNISVAFVGNNGTRFDRSENSASLALDLQPSIGLGFSQAYSRPITQTFEAGFNFKHWF